MDSLSCNESTRPEIRKRVHDDSEVVELAQTDVKKRGRYDSENTESTRSESKLFKEDFLDDLDDSDICTTSPDLDLFMKSFEQEIAGAIPAKIVNLETDSGESRPDLGYLLEASDDELGIPPSEKPIDTELFRVTTESTELWRFDEQVSGYDSFDLGFNDEIYEYKSNSAEFVALDSLFDFTDSSFGLPAL
ncbi:hypothetical protein DCAR_0727143 [Daucus carota subsp. sativus]|uniref:Uncharacterized protein n=1 Tax=Daucus carota subsp. sativus TaxID=79200 RepID=A0AAF0XGK9_DAUCS|nr:PREDICTED: uncharacterized protein LOC108193887 [Daucus carota subsp. sativus]WOH07710.1 hypothetical protein DCAR_0727143 [Daucus carota subsp. sativus]